MNGLGIFRNRSGQWLVAYASVLQVNEAHCNIFPETGINTTPWNNTQKDFAMDDEGKQLNHKISCRTIITSASLACYHQVLTSTNSALTFIFIQLAKIPALHRVAIVKLLTQHVVKGDSLAPTSGCPPCWWWGYQSFAFTTGLKCAATFPPSLIQLGVFHSMEEEGKPTN